MANAWKLQPGQLITYIGAGGKRSVARVATVVNQTTATLRVRNQANTAWLSLNGGANISKRSAANQTNVWTL
jgi:hypothetical protein